MPDSTPTPTATSTTDLVLFGWTDPDGRGVRAAFSTRAGGRSTGSYAALNLAEHVGDDYATVLANRAILAAAVGVDPADVVSATQVHGADLVDVDGHEGPDEGGWRGIDVEADALLTETRRPIAMLVADCAPIAVVGDNGHVVVHGGWRGVANGVIERAVAALQGDLHAVVGPMLGVECFEIGPEVAAQFPASTETAADGRTLLNLRAEVERRLRAAGVVSVEQIDICTACDERCFSYRRDGDPTGRQCVLAWGE